MISIFFIYENCIMHFFNPDHLQNHSNIALCKLADKIARTYKHFLITKTSKIKYFPIGSNYCSDFRGKRNIYARCDFFSFSQFSPIKIIILNKNFMYPIEDIDFFCSNVRKDISLRIFFVNFWGLENCQFCHVLD